MAHGLAEQHFHSYEDVKKWVDAWVASKEVTFFRHGIQMLPKRSEKVVASDKEYFQTCFEELFENKALIFTKKQRELIQDTYNIIFMTYNMIYNK